MSNRNGRTIRRALAVALGLGGLGFYATAQQPSRPIPVKSTAPGVYTVDGPTPGALLPPTMMPGVPVQPKDTAVASDVGPVAPTKPILLPNVPLPPVENAVARENPSLMPLAPLPPKPPTDVTPVGLVTPDAPQAPATPAAPITPTVPAPQVTQTVPVTVKPAPTATTTPITPAAPAALVQQAPVMIIQPASRQKPRVVEQTTMPVAAQTPAVVAPPAPTAPTPPVLLAPVPGPTEQAPRAVATPSVLPQIPTAPTPTAQTPTPSVLPPQTNVTQAPKAVVVPTVRTPVAVNQPAPVVTPAPVVQAPVTPQPTPVATAPPDTDSWGTCSKCSRLKSHGQCCACAPATVPPPVGASVRAAFGAQRANALEEYCVIFREDFDLDADTLNPTGERHISGIARRFDQTHAPVRIEPTGNAALDKRRVSVVISTLTKCGIPAEVAANRVVCGTSRAEGMQTPDIEPTNYRYGVASYGYGYTSSPTYGAFATFGPFLPYR